MCHVSRVACHLTLTPTAAATDPRRVNSQTVHNRMVGKDPLLKKTISEPNLKIMRPVSFHASSQNYICVLFIVFFRGPL